MKRSILLVLVGLLVIEKYAYAEIKVDRNIEQVTLKCKESAAQDAKDKNWTAMEESSIVLDYEERTETFTCGDEKILVRIRTCENCIELDTESLAAIIVGNVVVTALIGWAVYSITAQPKLRMSSAPNKASDKRSLIQNGEGDTYQQLSGAQRSEYSTLGNRKK